MKDYKAWVVELYGRGSHPTTYFALDHMLQVHWVSFVDDAVHFARRADADRVAEMMENLDIGICEHLWPNGDACEPVIPDWSCEDVVAEMTDEEVAASLVASGYNLDDLRAKLTERFAAFKARKESPRK